MPEVPALRHGGREIGSLRSGLAVYHIQGHPGLHERPNPKMEGKGKKLIQPTKEPSTQKRQLYQPVSHPASLFRRGQAWEPRSILTLYLSV